MKRSQRRLEPVAGVVTQDGDDDHDQLAASLFDLQADGVVAGVDIGLPIVVVRADVAAGRAQLSGIELIDRALRSQQHLACWLDSVGCVSIHLMETLMLVF